MTEQLLRLYDAGGNLLCVQIAPSLWQKIEPAVERLLGDASPKQRLEDDLGAFGEFLKFWDFKYPYEPAVDCPHCHASTSDWRNDPARPFRLANANIGGLLVFHCENCGATVRQKYFRDHKAVEYSLPG